MNRLLDWRLRRAREQALLPDLPEVRRLMRLSWWNGLTFGAMERRVGDARVEAFDAMVQYSREHPGEGWEPVR